LYRIASKTGQFRYCGFFTLRAAGPRHFEVSLDANNQLSGQSQENQYCLIDADQVRGIEMPDAISQFAFWNRRDLVDHEPRDCGKSVLIAWLDHYSKERGFALVASDDADRDRTRRVEAISRLDSLIYINAEISPHDYYLNVKR
jgi:hypothetical protein